MKSDNEEKSFLSDLKKQNFEVDFQIEVSNKTDNIDLKQQTEFVSEIEDNNEEVLQENLSQQSQKSGNDDPGYFDKTAKMKSRKEIKKIDTKSKIYNAIRKNMYVECTEISAMSEKEVEEVRKSLGEIKVRG